MKRRITINWQRGLGAFILIGGLANCYRVYVERSDYSNLDDNTTRISCFASIALGGYLIYRSMQK